MSYELRHKLFNHLDNPLRFLLWTVPEAFVLIAPVLIGVGVGHAFWGLLISGTGFWSMREWSRLRGRQSLKALLYWHFPHNKKVLKVTPPSYVREFVG